MSVRITGPGEAGYLLFFQVIYVNSNSVVPCEQAGASTKRAIKLSRAANEAPIGRGDYTDSDSDARACRRRCKQLVNVCQFQMTLGGNI